MFQQNSVREGQIIEAKHSQYPNRKFKIIKLLGKGGEGEVYTAQPTNWIENQVPYVALKFELQHTDLTFIQNLMQYQLNNENSPFGIASGIIKIFDIFTWNQFQVIAMEEGSTDLYNYLQNNPQDKDDKKILLQLATSIRFLHYNSLIHRDLKPENYIKAGDKFKLIDFGLIRKKQRLQTPNVGTPLFQAPEVADGNQNYSTPADIWSLGCVFFEVLTKKPLFETQNASQQRELLKAHCSNPHPIYDRVEKLIPDQFFQKLIKEMIHPIPEQRTPIEVIYKSINSYLQQGNNQTIQPNLIVNNNNNKFVPSQFPKQFQSQQIVQGQQNEKSPQQFQNIQVFDKNDQMTKELKNFEERIEKQFQEKLQNQSTFLIQSIQTTLQNQNNFQSFNLQNKFETMNKTVSDLSIQLQKQQESQQKLIEISQQKAMEMVMQQINTNNQQQQSQMNAFLNKIEIQLNESKQGEERQNQMNTNLNRIEIKLNNLKQGEGAELKNLKDDSFEQLKQICDDMKKEQIELKQQLIRFQDSNDSNFKKSQEHQLPQSSFQELIKGLKLNEVQQQLLYISQQGQLMKENLVRIEQEQGNLFKLNLDEYSIKIKDQINDQLKGLGKVIENKEAIQCQALLVEIYNQLNQQILESQKNLSYQVNEPINRSSQYSQTELYFELHISQEAEQADVNLNQFTIVLGNFDKEFDEFCKLSYDGKKDIEQKIQEFIKITDHQNIEILENLIKEQKIQTSKLRQSQLNAKQFLQSLNEYIKYAKENILNIKTQYIGNQIQVKTEPKSQNQ